MEKEVFVGEKGESKNEEEQEKGESKNEEEEDNLQDGEQNYTENSPPNTSINISEDEHLFEFDQNFYDLEEEADIQEFLDFEPEVEIQDYEEDDLFYDVEDAESNFEGTPLDFELPLFIGANITFGESLLAILFFCLRYRLSATCGESLLELLRIHLPKDTILPSSYYIFKQYFIPFADVFIMHDFCDVCYYKFNDQDVRCPHCPNKLRFKGGEEMQSKREMAFFFLEIPVEKEIGKKFQDKEFLEDIKYKLNRQKINANNFEDIFDGKNYTNVQFLKAYANLSLGFFLDGMSVFNSSNWQMWPLLFLIHDLPPEKRFQTISVAGLWFGRNKPDANLYLRPMVASMNKFAQREVVVPACNGETYRPQIATISFSADLPAKSLAQSMNQYNGQYGCGYCYQPGDAVPGVPGSRFYSCSPRDHALRTTKSVISDAKIASRTKSTHRGMKRPSILFLLPYFNFIWGFAIDFMHACCLGVARKMLFLWFDSSNHKKSFYQGARLDHVDKLLEQITPPAFVSRAPRSFRKHGKYWKGLNIDNDLEHAFV
eukprot:Pompholyxophrys_punicea_v1_NODE_116_length_3380_cov_12.119699.p1 type:complete len:544 gc:universal NODE_116_length_3380_cov_12.119699:1974-343(-)